MAAVSASLKSNFQAVGGLAIFVLLIFVVNLLAAGRIITGRILNSIALTIINNIMLLFGFMMSVVGWYLFAYKENAGGNPLVVNLVVACGMLFLIISIQGHVGVFKKRIRVMVSYMFFSLVLLGLAGACTYACFTEVSCWMQ